MSTSFSDIPTRFWVKGDIDIDTLFDGRLASYGVWESRKGLSYAGERCLTDGQNFMLANQYMNFSEEDEQYLLSSLDLPLLGGDPRKILDAIAKEFGAEFVFELSHKHFKPDFWKILAEMNDDIYEPEAPQD